MTKRKLKKKVNFKKKSKISNILVKIILIIFILSGIYYTKSSYSNSISLLAVSENSRGNPIDGSVLHLNLKITPGSGKVYINTNTIEEVDTQISIINSQKIACELFSLNCDNYNFYYDFEDSALLLKGPSASSAIAILTVKTMKREKIDNSTIITGSLNSGGIIGSVGGITEKIEAAKKNGFKKVLIPLFSNYNQTDAKGIKIIKVMDIIEAYNHFDGSHFKLKTEKINSQKYNLEMKKLSDKICERTQLLKNSINYSAIPKNSTLEKFRKQAQNSYNLSISAENSSNYYSRGSFCYNSNINNRFIIENQKNLSITQINNQLANLKNQAEQKLIEINSNKYKENIKTINDFYVYLILNNRLEEAKKFIDDAFKIKIQQQNSNTSQQIKTNSTKSTLSNLNNTHNQIEQIKQKKRELYSYAIERFYTVNVWEEFITHTGENIKFNQKNIDLACQKITKETAIKEALLDNYGLGYFKKDVEEQSKFTNPLANKYLCLYNGFQLNGKIDTVLNSMGMTSKNQKTYVGKILNFTNSRLSLNSNGNFPLIPYMYEEYAKDLYKQNDFGSSMLYTNYALSYADLNLYLEKENTTKGFFNMTINSLFENIIFVGALLVLLVFL